MVRYREKHPEQRQIYNELRRQRPDIRMCAECGQQFPRTRSDRIFCSRKCLTKAKGRRRPRDNRDRRGYFKVWRETNHEKRVRYGLRRQAKGASDRFAKKRLILELRLLRRLWKLSQAPKPHGNRKLDGLNKADRSLLKKTGGQTVIAYGNCAYCGRFFVHRAAVPTKFCCASHGHRMNRGSRHLGARKRRRIADRDGWKCHICGRKVPDRPYRALPDDPTIDHLIPVAFGGRDALSNLALAHNKCNTDRGTGGNAQLRLIA
jgi:hypothetical protein